jgi:transposase-like protein
MNKPVVAIQGRTIARPLKVLIPLIQGEIQMGNEAGHDHYVKAGEMLIEAKDQIAHGGWGRWLAKNFDLSDHTARVWMRWARHQNERGPLERPYASLSEMRGDTDRAREERQSKQQKDFRRLLRDVARDTFVQERQSRDDEIKLHRDLAEELIDIGYRALATRLHPDRGGSKDAMARLNRVRDELKAIAETRRFL